MSKRKIQAGSLSVTMPVFIQNTSSTVGSGLTGLTASTSGLAWQYRRENQSSWTSIGLASGTLGVWTSGGFVNDSGVVQGGYELGIPNAVLATGVTWAQMTLYGATNMLPVLIEIELDTINYQVTNGKLPVTLTSTDVTGNIPADLQTIKTNSVVSSGITTFPSGELLSTRSAPNVIWDELLAAHSGVGTAGKTLSSAGSAGDPWNTVLPGSYGLGTAGYLLGSGIPNQTNKIQTFPTNFSTLVIDGNGYVGVSYIGTDVINSGSISSTAVTELQLGLARSGDRMDLINAPNSTAITAIQAGLSTLTQSDIRTSVGLTSANLDAQLSGISVKFTGIPNLVWNENLTSHTGVNIAGQVLLSAGSAGDPWNTALPGTYPAGTAGYILGSGIPSFPVNFSSMSINSDGGTLSKQYYDVQTSSYRNYPSGLSTINTTLFDASISSRSTYAGTPVGVTGTVVLSSGTHSGAIIPRVSLVDVTTLNSDMITQSNIRSAIGMSSGNLDIQLSGILANIRSVATGVLGAGDIDGYSLEQTQKLILSALAGKLSGAATTTNTFRAADDSTNRITATVDSDGNRTSITLNANG